MCGIAGFAWGPQLTSREPVLALLATMGRCIERRGPDSEGQWTDVEGGVGFAHRRLAIVDLSIEGAQPMHSRSGRFTLSYNGEIYNHEELRAQLAGPWRGTSDTETLLAAFEAWGVRQTIERAVGMFALSLWDRDRRVLTLARDRFGEKPLYYGWQGGSPGAVGATFLFGSDLAALRAHPAFEGRIDRGALRSFMRFNNVAGEACIHEGLRKLGPGSLLEISRDQPVPRVEVYWSTPQLAAAAAARGFHGDDMAAIEELECRLGASIRRQMMADVPIGAFLSGGIDSSVIVALMQRVASQPVRTFTIGFSENALDESPHARAVARHIGTDHTELFVSPQDVLDLVPQIAGIYTEPFADSSQLPTYLLSKLTRGHVTVALSGDCGDELFGGYNRYIATARWWQRFGRVPMGVRRTLARALLSIPASLWGRDGLRGEKVQKMASLLSRRSLDDLYLALVSHWEDPAQIVVGGEETAPLTPGTLPEIASLDPVTRLMITDTVGYMNDDILTKVDRASMAVSLESRVPFLDPTVAEFAWRLPLDLKLRGGTTKWILRQVLYRHVPRPLVDRPKAGFAVPIGAWLRGPLRAWAEDLLSVSSLERDGLLRAAPIRRCWEEHVAGRRNWYPQLWNVLMFQSWIRSRDVR